jgi:hypothetical protein
MKKAAPGQAFHLRFSSHTCAVTLKLTGVVLRPAALGAGSSFEPASAALRAVAAL